MQKRAVYKYRQVMLIDDNDLDNFVNQKTLESVNFSEKIYVSTEAQSALEFFKNVGFASKFPQEIFPQVIFIDLNMPAINGYQFINYLSALLGNNLANFKLVILTSSIYQEDELKVKSLSEDIIFLRKPLTATMLEGL